MSALISSIVAFIIAGLAIFGLVPHQQMQPIPQLPQQVVEQTTKNSTSEFFASPISGPAPLSVTFTWPRDDTTFTYWLDLGNGYGIATPCPAGAGDCQKGDYYVHTAVYDKSGVYTAKVTRGYAHAPFGPEKIIGTATITVAGFSQKNISVPGMSKYTDADFGFSFWYPNGWKVEKNSVAGPDGNSLSYLNISNSSQQVSIEIDKNLSSLPITWTLSRNCTDTFSFDVHTGASTMINSGCSHDTERYQMAKTMGGLPSLSFSVANRPHSFIPLGKGITTIDSLLVSGNIDPIPLAKTILATDPSVATPVSVAEQIKIIQAEKDAYAGQ